MTHDKQCIRCPSQGERFCRFCDVYLKAEGKARRRERRQGRAHKQQALPIYLGDAVGTPPLLDACEGEGVRHA